MISCHFTAINSPSLCKNNTGLGNVLFQISTTYGLSKKLDMEYSVPELKKLLTYLDSIGLDHGNTIFRNVNIFDLDKKQPITISEKNGFSQMYDQTIESRILKINHSIVLIGYLQSHNYFNKYRADIIKLFTPDISSYNYIWNKYPNVFDPESVSVHIRHHYGNIQYNGNYYRKACSVFPESHFFVFSNDAEKSLEIFNEIDVKYTIVSENPDYIDLWMMSFCKHNILSHSTLSWWGAYLNTNPTKRVLYPEDALRISHGHLHSMPQKVVRKKQHYLLNWECIPCCRSINS